MPTREALDALLDKIRDPNLAIAIGGVAVNRVKAFESLEESAQTFTFETGPRDDTSDMTIRFNPLSERFADSAVDKAGNRICPPSDDQR